MAEGAAPVPARLRKSRYLSWFGHMGAVYLFHDLYGYLMEMSPDIAEMIESFSDGVDTKETVEYYRGKLGDANPQEFVEILAAHAVLVDPNEDEVEGIWAFVPIHGKWNIWRRRDGRLTLWTAWGDRPVQQIFLDEDETKMWDAFDGNKRLIELRHHHDNKKLAALVKKLVHSDVQALKMSVMPWGVYAKRPAMAPPYLTSTMPYDKWAVGTKVPGQREAMAGDARSSMRIVSPTEYYKVEVQNADEQFDHQETTLSHLLRIPHPALHGKTYGEALIDALIAKKDISEGKVRVLEIGAGLGFVAQHAIARLKKEGREVDYTILELAPALAEAQQKRVGKDAAKWIIGDATEVELPTDSFDLVICNEMVGDLPAIQLSRADIGLLPDQGNADRDKVRTYSRIAADRGVNLDDAPEPFYLMSGAFDLVEKIGNWLAPGGTAVVTEFGDYAAWPKLSTHLDHPELSTHFGQLQQAAKGAGHEASLEFVIDLLDFDRDQKGLATTRSHFRALRALAADAGVDLQKIGYTPELFAAAVGDKLDVTAVGELRWDKIEDRLMGLVPHEFKALLIRRAR
ncbi:MAG TPA: class I SAM-dependent methyltransferase [Kofleriaceae bacterium]|jgi:SAM-dependent methyltransferase